MQAFTVLVFDELISGTSESWHTSASLEEKLGSADELVLHAVTTAVSGSSPTLTCRVETSANARDWLEVAPSPVIDGASLSNGSSHAGVTEAVLHRFVRVRVTLGGSSPACRLKLHVTGRMKGQVASRAFR